MESKKKSVLICAAIFLILAVEIAAAELIISQPKSLYNVGDDFNISVGVNAQKDSTGFLTVKLACGSNETELYRNPLNAKKDKVEEIKIKSNFGVFLVGDSEGECYFNANYDGETAASQRFILSRGIEAKLNVDGGIFSPGDEIKISGEAKKKNGEVARGFVEIKIDRTNTSTIESLQDGKFDFVFRLPENAFSGEYGIQARVYEKDGDGNVINEGFSGQLIQVKQVMKEIAIAVDKKSIAPNNELIYSVFAYDQTGGSMDAEASVSIFRPDGSLSENKLIKTGEESSIKIESNYPSGNWKIEASIKEFDNVNNFIVEEYKNVDFKLENNTLIIENTGNVPYDGFLEVVIGGAKEIKNIKDLKIGEIKKFRLLAPEGEYKIEVGDSSSKQELGTAFLTGRAISVEDIRDFSGSNFIFIVWVILILAVATISLYFYKKIRKKRYIGKVPSQSFLAKKAVMGERKDENAINRGEKHEAVIVSLKIKNSQVLKEKNSEAAKTLESALWKAKEEGAKVYLDGDYRIIILTKILTKEADNLTKGFAAAQTIERILGSYNRKAKEKIKFGIGINIGEIVAEVVGGQFKFASVGNIIASTKRISENAEGNILISEEIRRRTAGKIKATKLKDKNFWTLDKVTDREIHKDYVSRFTKS